MPSRVKVAGGYLIVEGISPGRPDNSLPGVDGPVDPGWGVDEGTPPGIWPGLPNHDLPIPPPGVWPPLTPSHPIQPTPPGSFVPPGTIWPPVFPPDPGYGVGIERPDQGLPRPPGAPDQGLPKPPGTPDQGLPGAPPVVDNTLPRPHTFWVVCGIPGVGWRYVCVDPTLKPGHPIAPGGGGGRPDNTLPPTAQPKR